MRRTPLVLIVAWACASCGGGATVTRERTPPPNPGPAAHSRPRIDDEATWGALASRPQNHHVARTTVVKFVFDLRGEAPRLYFLQSREFESHWDFVHQVLEDMAFRDGYDFYQRVYRTEDRPYLVGSIVRYEDAGAWTFELISGDTLSAERILWTLERLRETTFFGDQIRFRPTSDVHLERVRELAGRLPVTDDDALYGALRYQPIQLGITFGTLRFVEGTVQRGSISPREIVVTDEVPDDLPLCAALITSRFQAPLAHVAVLSGNRGTPDMALRDAIRSESLRALEGQIVRLEVGAQDYTIAAASSEDADRFYAAQGERPTFSPPLDLSQRDLLDQCSLGFDSVDVAGAKAANMGVLCGLRERGIQVPDGFVVPFAHYMQHLRSNHLDQRIRAFLDGDARHHDPTEALAALQQAIRTSRVDPALVRRVRQRIGRLAPGGRVRMRSSTNAEDLPGFNGAGLYSSLALSADATDAQVADGLREIWASVWNLGAFQEREHYHIDHEQVAMAVLVQYSIDDAVANGVALTRNPYDPLRSEGVLINIQRTGASVTGAHGDQIPEQWLVFTYLPAREPELLARSTLTDGEALLRREEVLAFTEQLEMIHQVFTPRFSDGSNAVDVEMLLAGADRHFVLVQARPYRVVWNGREGVGR
ncbi:MAG: PEP/pyruvate-binding domain-containing protein [Sandaracinaceae bacterium]